MDFKNRKPLFSNKNTHLKYQGFNTTEHDEIITNNYRKTKIKASKKFNRKFF